MVSHDLVKIASYGNSYEASIAQGAMEDHGIRAYVSGALAGTIMSYYGSALGGVKLLVASEDVERALSILKEMSQEATVEIPAWECPECHSENEAGFEICWSCGTVAPDATTGLDLSSVRTEIKSDTIENEINKDALATRAFRASIIGLVILPFSFYAIYLQILLRNAELKPSSDRLLMVSRFLVLLGLLTYWLMFSGSLDHYVGY